MCKNVDNVISKANLPYIQGTRDKISHILRKQKIMTTFKHISTIHSYLKYAKDPIDPKFHKGVYIIPCSCGIPYLGEIGRSFNTHIIEHSANIKHNRIKNSTLEEHSNNTKHQIYIEKTHIFAKVDDYFHRKFREAIEINKHPKNLNRDKVWIISKNWIPTLKPIPEILKPLKIHSYLTLPLVYIILNNFHSLSNP